MPTYSDWSCVIGRFLLNFGTLDYLIFVFLKNHLSSDEFTRIKEWHLKDRLTKVDQYLNNNNYPKEQQIAFTRLIEQFEPVRELRNQIAHGYLLIRFDEKTRQPIVTIFKAKDLDMECLHNAKHVHFEELAAALATLDELIQDFEQLAGFKQN